MKVCVIAIGDELLLGSIVDTNTPFIASLADAEGWDMVWSCHVGDEAADIREAVSEGFRRADVVLTTGGLGPTKDDITKQVMCGIFGCGMRRDEEVAANVERIFRERGLKMNDLTTSQAMVPDKCQVVPNAVGTAPIMWFDRDDKVLVSMPGVPREMRYVFVNEVIPRLRSRFSTVVVTHMHRFVNTESISESDVNAAVDLLPGDAALRSVHLAYLPQSGYLRLRVDGADEALLDRAVGELRAILGDHVIYEGDLTPAEALVARLCARGLTVSSAESCTGGNIAHLLTLVPGSSEVYMGSVVSYSNDVKHRVLGVGLRTLEENGAVSIPVVEEMVAGAARVAATDCAMATSGIAGPGGAVPGKPVGTVCIAVKTPAGVRSATCRFPGDRREVITRASVKAITMLLREL